MGAVCAGEAVVDQRREETVAGGQRGAAQAGPEDAHVGGEPVGVVVAPAEQVAEVGRVVGHRVPDDVAQADPVAGLKVAHQAQRGAHLRLAGEDLGVGPARPGSSFLDHLDRQSAVVQADGVSHAHVQGHELVDGAVLVDDEVRRHAGQLAEVRGVRREHRPRAPVGRARGVVEDDDAGAQQPGPRAVVALGVGGHLATADAAVGDVVAHDGRPGDRRGWRRRRARRSRRRRGRRRRRRPSRDRRRRARRRAGPWPARDERESDDHRHAQQGGQGDEQRPLSVRFIPAIIGAGDPPRRAGGRRPRWPRGTPARSARACVARRP